MIVVSTEIVVALYLTGETTEIAEAVLRRDPSWASPLLWRTLFPHYVSEPLRSGAITAKTVEIMLEEAEHLFRSREFPAPLKENMSVLFNSGCSAFATPFVSLAKGLSIPLVTTDAEAIKAFPEIAMSAADFAAGHPLPAAFGATARAG